MAGEGPAAQATQEETWQPPAAVRARWGGACAAAGLRGQRWPTATLPAFLPITHAPVVCLFVLVSPQVASGAAASSSSQEVAILQEALAERSTRVEALEQELVSSRGRVGGWGGWLAGVGGWLGGCDTHTSMPSFMPTANLHPHKKFYALIRHRRWSRFGATWGWRRMSLGRLAR